MNALTPPVTIPSHQIVMFLSGFGGCTRGRKHEKKRVYGHVPLEGWFRIRRCDHDKKLRIQSARNVSQRSGELFYERIPLG
ncbi:hypothetical protein TNCT_494151 [Trichonephila clavata]|uniref:Uncharacterized protein n=1 Tax=Trichonephila clavata TaxID=2740835 RepID=A0A8X6GWP3_TRICU|nr:hypothetical protein TNCT_82111 [Trichonephila clavata]GFQ91333.1 hypothetical protein TNCT_494151 [Trichonephila clavata]